jgi:hypothetical protein
MTPISVLQPDQSPHHGIHFNTLFVVIQGSYARGDAKARNPKPRIIHTSRQFRSVQFESIKLTSIDRNWKLYWLYRTLTVDPVMWCARSEGTLQCHAEGKWLTNSLCGSVDRAVGCSMVMIKICHIARQTWHLAKGEFVFDSLFMLVASRSVPPCRCLGGCFNPHPEIQNFYKVEPNSQVRGIYIHNNRIRIWVSLFCKLSGTPD